MDPESEYQESTALSFEWTLRGLKDLFDSSKGDAKSQVTKSARFGSGRWQVLFYANAGIVKEGQEGRFISLFLSCEPTLEERERAVDDKWVRDGVYKFSFEIRNVGKSVLYNMKEAHNHTFSHKTANWGWAQFARRDNIFYNTNAIKSQDALVILCTITSSPVAPLSPPTTPRLSVPRGLLETVGALLDDPTYSDVEFIISKGGRGSRGNKRIFAARRLLERSGYFKTMFGSGFSESNGPQVSTDNSDGIMLSGGGYESSSIYDSFEDSDSEYDELDDADLESMAPQTPDVTNMNSSRREDVTETAERNIEAQNSRESTPPLSSRGTTLVPDSARDLNRLAVVIKDVAYTTYRAMIYYIYTESIVFAPLSSSFANHSGNEPTPSESPSVSSSSSEAQGNHSGKKSSQLPEPASSRREWIKQWMKNNAGRPTPCSAKSIFRLADRLDLRDLKERAFQHIIKSITTENIAHEVFSPFSAAFDDVRKVQVDYFLQHWAEIRSSDSIRQVWKELRNGRHPGFDDVWPIITMNLEYKPPTSSSGPGEASPTD